MKKNKNQLNYYQVAASVFALLVGAEMTPLASAAEADEIGLDFSVPDSSEALASTEINRSDIAPKKLAPPEPSVRSAVGKFAPLEIAAPYFIDRTPPGSYDFTLLRRGKDTVEIPSPCTGTVTQVKYSSQGYGNRVEVQCERSGYVYFMAHLGSISVRIGQRVVKGQSLGIQGSTGNSTGPHVHLEIGDRPFLEFYPENRIANREITSPLVYEYLRFVSAPPAIELRSPNVEVARVPKPIRVDLPSEIGLEFDVLDRDYRPQPAEALGFEPTVATVVQTITPSRNGDDLESPELENSQTSNSSIDRIPDRWWQQGSDSPIAIAIGAAEGTRHSNGSKRPAYYWHKDPGNSQDNFGTFSYQHLQSKDIDPVKFVGSPARKRLMSALEGLPNKADKLQLQRLKRYHDRLRAQAIEKGLLLNREELVNGLDLSNQSPAAGLLEGGYIDRLAQMKQLVDQPSEQIVEARIWAYWDMDKNRWDAPGLGNTYPSIRRDQLRRYQAVKQVLALHSESGDVDGLRP